MVFAILKNSLSAGSLVFVDTEKREDEIMELRVLELSLHGTPQSSPPEHVPLSPEEVLPVVGDVGEDSPKTPHVSGGGDVGIISPKDLGRQIADVHVVVLAVVHGGGGLACTG